MPHFVPIDLEKVTDNVITGLIDERSTFYDMNLIIPKEKYDKQIDSCENLAYSTQYNVLQAEIVDAFRRFLYPRGLKEFKYLTSEKSIADAFNLKDEKAVNNHRALVYRALKRYLEN